MAFVGVDIGSVSVKIARIGDDGALLSQEYRRHFGHPQEVAREMISEGCRGEDEVRNIGFTGSGGKQAAEALGAPFENEIAAQARAAAQLTPQVRTLIEIGGEDSRLIILDPLPAQDGQVNLRDFAMNSLCAAGCGSFLDQQATRVGVKIEDEFGALALTSLKPARVAGRCSVFAKTDMIHLQQQATPVCDIIAGLCFAFARNFISVVARGKEIVPPVAFHGGVSANAGMVRAFRELLELSADNLFVPPHAATAGAVGAALFAREQGARHTPIDANAQADIAGVGRGMDTLPRLPDPGAPPPSRLATAHDGPTIDAYLGVDVGSISTNVVLIDADKRVLAKQYLRTAGRPIEAVRQGLAAVGAEWADRVQVRGVCTTGSGRYLTGDFLGADVVKNEITAQARAAVEIDPTVDTIFEIGGQDSKFISLERGAIVDFEMNKVCAAGTGSFLEEQAERLGIDIKGEFADAALSAEAPVRMGDRCTVFMESDLVGYQARGASTAELCAGLAYSTVDNYLNRVVGERKIGERIFFQGGTAFNRAVVSAFRQVTGKPVVVPEHHEVTGAIGCALLAREAARPDVPSGFKGWDLSTRTYKQDSFACQGCTNHCEINRVKVDGEATLFYGGRCEKYERRRAAANTIRDLFAERERLLLAGYWEGEAPAESLSRPASEMTARQEPRPPGPLIGIPRTLHFSEYLPFWLAFFRALNLPVLLSSPTGKAHIEHGTEETLAEYCFPVKVAHGHVRELLDAGVSHIFTPNVQQLPHLHDGYKESVACPYVQSAADTFRAALQPEKAGVAMLAPVVYLHETPAQLAQRMVKPMAAFGCTKKQLTAALTAAFAAQREFTGALREIGREVLDSLGPDERAVVIVSRPYNGCDNGINLELPRRFRELGVLPIPLDMLPVDDIDLSAEFPDLTWRYGQKILAGADIIRRDPRLAAVYLTNFGCGPDSFLLKFFRERMGGKVFLTIEVDEHSSDVGAITRCEAFLDSLRSQEQAVGVEKPFRRVEYSREKTRTMYIPRMSDLALALAAAFRGEGVPAQALPESDAESVALAKRFCTGKECFPCIVTTGDIIRQIRQPDFNADEAVFFMPSVSGGCRFGYYHRTQRMVLDELGCENVPIFSPNQNDGFYTSLDMQVSDRFVRRAWQGIIATELLQKARAWVRPREVSAGQTEMTYHRQLAEMERMVEDGSDLLPMMRTARADFAAIPVRETDYPWIGMFGEVFVREHHYSNQQLIKRLEELGAHVWLVPFSEWLFYINLLEIEDNKAQRRWKDYLRTGVIDKVMQRDESRLASAWDGFIPNLHETSPQKTIELGSRYVDPAYRGDAVLCMGKAIEMYHGGIAGLINVMPLTCMPGTITSGLLKRFQQEHDGMPALTLAFDGQGDGHLPIRLEAFVQQCRSFKRRVKGDRSQ